LRGRGVRWKVMCPKKARSSLISPRELGEENVTLLQEGEEEMPGHSEDNMLQKEGNCCTAFSERGRNSLGREREAKTFKGRGGLTPRSDHQKKGENFSLQGEGTRRRTAYGRGNPSSAGGSSRAPSLEKGDRCFPNRS